MNLKPIEDKVKKQGVKCDLHVHIDGNISKENIIKWLDNAEKNGVKYLSILEHYNLDLYREGSALQELCQSGEIEKHYSGKLITGVEMTLTIDDGVVSKYTGYNFSGHPVHITCLNFDVEKAEKLGMMGSDGHPVQWLKPGFLPEALKKNEKIIRSILKQKNLPEPPEGYFVYDGSRDTIEKQLYHYYYTDRPELGEFFDSEYGTSQNVSDFVRTYVENPKGPLHFDNIIYPKISEALPKFKKIAVVALSHPAYMNGEYDFLDYVETMMDNYRDLFDTIEVPYSQNHPFETEILYQYAKHNGMPFVAGGTDSCITKSGQMYLMMNGQKIMYTPNLGNGKKSQLLGGMNNGDIILSQVDLNKMKFADLRNQKRFESNFQLNQD